MREILFNEIYNEKPNSAALGAFNASIGADGVGGSSVSYQSKKYDSQINVGERYYDNRYGDAYTIEKMTKVEGGDVDVTLKYDKGKTRIESGDFILYHIDAKQHSKAKF